MNIHQNLESSETTREALSTINFLKKSFFFNTYQTTSSIIKKKFTFTKRFFPKHKKNIDSSFLEWFIGFSEGKNCFYSNIVDNRPRLQFKIVQTDVKLMYKIRTHLGFGRVSCFIDNNQTYWKYSIEDKANLQRIMLLFNGNFVIPKKYVEFKDWIELRRDICPEKFFLKNQCVALSLKTAWLSGFVEAKGYFYATFQVNTFNLQASNFTQTLIINEKKEDTKSIILDEISLLFKNSEDKYITKKSDCNRLCFDSLTSQTQIVNYLSEFPFLGNKKITFRRWWRIYLCRQTLKEKNLTFKMIKKYKKLCLMINEN